MTTQKNVVCFFQRETSIYHCRQHKIKNAELPRNISKPIAYCIQINLKEIIYFCRFHFHEQHTLKMIRYQKRFPNPVINVVYNLTFLKSVGFWSKQKSFLKILNISF